MEGRKMVEDEGGGLEIRKGGREEGRKEEK